MNQNEIRKTVVLTVLGLSLLLASLVAPSIIAGSDKVVSLPVGSTFGGQISQYMGVPEGQTDLAKEGTDFSLDKSTFFANKTWAVVHIKALSNRVAEGGYALFQKKNGVYTLVLSPSTIFTDTSLTGAPDDLVAYLHTQGAVL